MQYSQSSAGPLTRLAGAFHPGWAPTLMVLALLPALLWLGGWQLSRAEEKRVLLAQHEARRTAAPVTLDALPNSPAPAFRRVRLNGHFDVGGSLLLDSRTRTGQVGVELLQPFHDRLSGRWVLLNRGWLPWPDRRQPVAFDTPAQALELVAWVYVAPGEPFRLNDAEESGWPRLVNVVDTRALWQRLHVEGYPHELRLEPGPAALAADWPVVSMGPEKHLGYAVQWFALGAALLGLYLYLGIQNAREARHASDSHIA